PSTTPRGPTMPRRSAASTRRSSAPSRTCASGGNRSETFGDVPDEERLDRVARDVLRQGGRGRQTRRAGRRVQDEGQQRGVAGRVEEQAGAPEDELHRPGDGVRIGERLVPAEAALPLTLSRFWPAAAGDRLD